MSTDTVEELREFHRFLTNKLSADGIDLSPEEALDEWRRLHPQTQASDEDVAALRKALPIWFNPLFGRELPPAREAARG